MVQRLVQHTRDLGVDLRLQTEVTAVEKHGRGYRLTLATADGPATIEADLVVHGAGRVPHTDGLDLEKAGVDTDGHGAVRVNEFLQSVSAPHVYAAGDVVAVAGSLPLTPVAGYESGIVASNLLGGNSRRPDYRGIPSVVFTVPPLAGVGLTEAEARRQGLDIRVKSEDTSGWYSNRRLNEPCAMFKTVVERTGGRLLGAHLLGPHAEEVINLFALAMRNDLTADAIRHQLYAYPTSGSDLPYMV